jgi:hypothetical protein
MAKVRNPRLGNWKASGTGGGPARGIAHLMRYAPHRGFYVSDLVNRAGALSLTIWVLFSFSGMDSEPFVDEFGFVAVQGQPAIHYWNDLAIEREVLNPR